MHSYHHYSSLVVRLRLLHFLISLWLQEKSYALYAWTLRIPCGSILCVRLVFGIEFEPGNGYGGEPQSKFFSAQVMSAFIPS
jgi:hypothetical protein